MILKNFIWDYSGRLLTMVVSLGITGTLSRILSPSDFGLMGLVMAVSGVAGMFLDFGFSSAIIQKSDIATEELSTIFYLNFAVGIFVYCVIYLSSPYIANYYNSINLANLLKVSALVFLFIPINLVPSALIQKQMLFKQQAIRNMIVTIFIGFCTIWLAFNGWGIWSLVFQSLLGVIFSIIINIMITKWRPTFYFNLLGIKSIFKYSIFMFLSSILNNVFTKFDIFFIGKVFNLPILGQYTRAQGFDAIVRGVSSSSLLSVLFPYFSRIQHNDDLVRKQWERFFNLICFTFFLFMGWAFISSKVIFIIIFGEKWLIASYYFKIITLIGFVYPLSSLALGIMEAKGQSQDFLRVEVLKKMVIFPCFIVAYFYGITWFLISLILSYSIALVLNLIFLKRSINYNIYNTILELIKYIVIFGLFLLIAYLINFDKITNNSNIVLVLIINTIFTLYYMIAVYLVQPSTLKFAYQSTSQIFKRK